MFNYSYLKTLNIYEKYDDPLLFTSKTDSGEILLFYYVNCSRAEVDGQTYKGIKYIFAKSTVEEVEQFELNERSLLDIFLQAILEKRLYTEEVYSFTEESKADSIDSTQKLREVLSLEETENFSYLDFKYSDTNFS